MKRIFMILTMLLLVFAFTGCVKPYDEPEFVTIEASQTAFLIPLVGDTTNQGAFESEEMLAQAKVATKEVQIPHRWVQLGRMNWDGEWRDSARLIIVERKPETREWTQMTDTGTSNRNQGIVAESKESISFTAQMNCSAQIDEGSATRFLYRYNNKTLSSVMDTEIRAMVESKFVEACSTLEMGEILLQKQEIMNSVRASVQEFFAERGITITVLGLKGDLTYNDPKIQDAINAKFTATKMNEAQTITNKTNIEKAEANKQVQIANAEAESKAIKLIQETLTSSPQYIEYIMAEKWNGVLPSVAGGDNANMFLNMTK